MAGLRASSHSTRRPPFFTPPTRTPTRSSPFASISATDRSPRRVRSSRSAAPAALSLRALRVFGHRVVGSRRVVNTTLASARSCGASFRGSHLEAAPPAPAASAHSIDRRHAIQPAAEFALYGGAETSRPSAAPVLQGFIRNFVAGCASLRTPKLLSL